MIISIGVYLPLQVDRAIDCFDYTEIGVIAIGTLSQFLVNSKMQILGENQQRRR